MMVGFTKEKVYMDYVGFRCAQTNLPEE